MDERLIQKAKEVIKNIQYITIATASKDGMPWNSAVCYGYDEGFNFF